MLSDGVGILDAMALITGLGLVILLSLKEMIRVSNSARTEVWADYLDVVITPLILVFGMVIVLRLVSSVIVFPIDLSS